MPKPTVPQPGPAPSAISQLDRELARLALAKRQQGKTGTTREENALKRVQAEQEDRQRWDYYRSVPRKHYKAMCARQDKVLNEQAARYRMPIAGPTVSFPDLIMWLHQFLAENAKRLSVPLGEDPLLYVESDDPWLTEVRKETALLKKLERETKERKLVPREKVHETMTRAATLLRKFGETLEREVNDDMRQLFDQMLDEVFNEIRVLNAD